MFQLWSIGLWLPMISIIIICQLNGFNSLTLLFIITLLILIHIISEITNHRVGKIYNLLMIITASIGILQWEHGLDEFFIIIMLISILPIIFKDVQYLFTIYVVRVIKIPVIIFRTSSVHPLLR